jgi:hypothetical protein
MPYQVKTEEREDGTPDENIRVLRTEKEESA